MLLLHCRNCDLLVVVAVAHFDFHLAGSHLRGAIAILKCIYKVLFNIVCINLKFFRIYSLCILLFLKPDFHSHISLAQM